MTKYSTHLLKLVPWILKHHVERNKNTVLLTYKTVTFSLALLAELLR